MNKNKIVVADYFRLGRNGDNFDEKLKIKIRANVKISLADVEKLNAAYLTSGHLYIVNDEATKLRNNKLNPEKKTAKKETQI